MYRLISFMLLMCLCPVSLLCGAEEITPAKAPSVDPPTKSKPESKKAAKKKSPFIFITEAETKKPDFGLVMECPSHAHGTPEEAKEKLKAILKTARVDCSTIAVCRNQQIETLEEFSPLIDRVMINPFISRRRDVLYPDSCLNGNLFPWPECDHPKINRLRYIRQIADSTKLLSLININGESDEIACTIDDIKWMVCAAIGSGFQGVVWRGDYVGKSFSSELGRFKNAIQSQIPDLSRAEFIGCVGNQEDMSISAMCCDDKVIIVILNNSIMKNSSGKNYSVPLSMPLTRVRVHLEADAAFNFIDAVDLYGETVPLKKNTFEVDVKGCEIVIVNVAKRSSHN